MSGEAACHRTGGDPPLTEDLIVNADGTLRNVWVRVVAGLGGRDFAPPAVAAEVDQEGCLFAPHVLMARTGQPILFRNSDPVLHKINTLARLNRGFNLSLPAPGMSVTRSFTKAEAVRIKCDVHTWMAAWIVVHDNPFQALTGDGGTFELTGLPEGAYEIEAWHEMLGTARQMVNVTEGERRDVEFSFSRPAR
jgi:plastocyanin